MVRQRARIRFRKQGDLRWIGHRDLVRAIERLFRRAGLKLAMSEGFHPKPKMSFPSALAVGIEGLDEVMEIELAESCPAAELHSRLTAQAPPGLTLARVELVPPGARKPQLRAATYQVRLPPERREQVSRRAAELLAAPQWPIARAGRRGPIDMRGFLENVVLGEAVLEFRLRAGREASPGPRDVLAALGLADLEERGLTISRCQVELEP